MTRRPLPEVFRLAALQRGLDEVSIARAWERLCKWAADRDIGQSDWDRYVGWELERARGTQTRPSGPVPADPNTPNLTRLRAAREAEEAAYKREAISLRDWLAKTNPHGLTQEVARLLEGLRLGTGEEG